MTASPEGSSTAPTHKAATIYDVAKRAGVSHQTVAMVLRGHLGFRPETRERVEDAVRDLAYRPNLSARSLATARSHRIGALVYELLEVGPSKTIQGASGRAREFGYILEIVSLDASDGRAVHRALSTLGQQNLAGVLAFAPVDHIAHELSTMPYDLPFIAETEVEHQTDESGLNTVGMKLLVDHLVGIGHRSFFHLSGPPDWIASRNRESALSAALSWHGLTLTGSVAGDWSAASGYSATIGLPLDGGVTALIVANDQMALGAQLALAERGIDVPGEVSVTGFDDTPEAGFYRPPLTTIHVDYGLQGQELVERLLIDIGVAVPSPTVISAPRLQVRASTGPARH